MGSDMGIELSAPPELEEGSELQRTKAILTWSLVALASAPIRFGLEYAVSGGWQLLIATLLTLLGTALAGLARWLVGRGQTIVGTWVFILGAVVAFGPAPFLVDDALPIVAICYVVAVLIIGLIVGPTAGFYAGFISSVLFALPVLLLHFQVLPFNSHVVPEGLSVVATIGFNTMVLILSAFLVREATGAIKRALMETRRYAQEMDSYRRQLEQRIERRTGELNEALANVQVHSDDLNRALEELQASQRIIRELSSPVVPVLQGIIVMSLVGSIDSQRAVAITAEMLDGLERYNAHIVILDITGVPVVDTQVTKILLESARAAQLMGSQTVLTGIRPEIAQTMVELGIETTDLVTRSDLQGGMEYAMEEMGLRLEKR
ncbi:MAG: STAS domain-containing protein [Anaerolineales bacterium]|nr:MAG: STAS domain-containing protein [Anaerolineales bacterium]